MPQVRTRRRHQVAATALVVSAGLLLTACTQAAARTDKASESSAAPVRRPAHQRRRRRAQALASSASAAALAAGVSGATGASPGVSSAPPPVLSGIDPLTGLPPTSPTAGKRPALAVKVDNVQGAWPQAGLNQADIVYDLPVEGGLTRLLAIFHSADVPVIGPIRSARPVDADILHLLGHSYFAFSGGTSSDLGPINDHSNATPMWWDVTPSLFVIRHDHAIPHQVFGTTAMLYAGGEARSPSTTPPPPMFSYQVAVPTTNAVPATTVTAQYSAATAAWTWNGTQYLRNQSGHADLLIGGAQVTRHQRGGDVGEREEHQRARFARHGRTAASGDRIRAGMGVPQRRRRSRHLEPTDRELTNEVADHLGSGHPVDAGPHLGRGPAELERAPRIG